MFLNFRQADKLIIKLYCFYKAKIFMATSSNVFPKMEIFSYFWTTFAVYFQWEYYLKHHELEDPD